MSKPTDYRSIAIQLHTVDDHNDQLDRKCIQLVQGLEVVLLQLVEVKVVLEGSEDYLKGKEASSLINPSNSTE